MVSRDKYRKLSELYVQGTELEIEIDGEELVIYMRALNQLEVEEARSAAQAARSRMVLALRDRGSEERSKFDATFAMEGREEIIDQIAHGEANAMLPKIMGQVQDDTDPEWQEKMEVLERHESLSPPNKEEEELIARINTEFFQRVRDELDLEVGSAKARLERMDDEALRERFHDFWIDRRGNEHAMAEYRIVEFYYAARVCDGVKNADGEWDHSACEQHRMRVWETREEVRELGDEMHAVLGQAMDGLNMSVREGKGLGSRPASSDSSQSTAEPEGSTPSTEETSEKHPGTSSSPSTTP